MSAFAMALMAAAIWGMAAFCEKMGLRGADPMAGVLARSLGVALGGVAVMFAVPDLGVKMREMGWPSFSWLAGGGLLASILGQVFFYRALKVGEIGKVATVGGAWPVMAFLLSVLFLHEAASPKKLLGVALVVLGVSLLR